MTTCILVDGLRSPEDVCCLSLQNGGNKFRFFYPENVGSCIIRKFSRCKSTNLHGVIFQ